MLRDAAHRHLKSPEDSAALARTIAGALKPGDTLLLEGPIGAGKTHFARSIIQSMLTDPEDVPSPTFTLVQTYETDAGEIWHLDLYRLTDPSELSELGLEDALEDAICIIEWPDRLGDDVPQNALRLTFALDADPDARQLTATAGAERWMSILRQVND
ncbi:tRNA (adenosine(37)-N6)-threonylcarbamoyltransferase complex ATPase subunit type 1 TsaE [Aliiroseovarius sp. YM-037]|uniref:tRNA (adenosine(37)-N6)-threonylcarbamoyltransferase complex ATPase subunit type 1 TsaE n=1 Tax=Aliiroseovarius sp. YM-037 TaxID=3341728 RepID=UPI003A806511